MTYEHYSRQILCPLQSFFMNFFRSYFLCLVLFLSLSYIHTHKQTHTLSLSLSLSLSLYIYISFSPPYWEDNITTLYPDGFKFLANMPRLKVKGAHTLFQRNVNWLPSFPFLSPSFPPSPSFHLPSTFPLLSSFKNMDSINFKSLWRWINKLRIILPPAYRLSVQPSIHPSF